MGVAKKIITGNNLMLFIPDQTSGESVTSWKSIAYATAHTLSISTETADISSKDHGIYGATEVVKVSWEITSENLFTEDLFDELFSKMTGIESGNTSGEIKPIKIVFSLKNETDNSKTVANGDLDNWTPIASGTQYQGSAYITSLTANANNGEKATFSVTLSGVGKIEKVTVPGK